MNLKYFLATAFILAVLLLGGCAGNPKNPVDKNSPVDRNYSADLNSNLNDFNNPNDINTSNDFNDLNQEIGGGVLKEEKFRGKITQISFGCAVDASCNMVVDGKKYVHFGHDTRGEEQTEWGTAEELWKLMNDSNQGVGKTVEVFAAAIGEDSSGKSYTIQGKKEYYIKVVG